MAMGPERSKLLHNFKMPCLKWGNQRFLRCMKVNPNGEVISAAAADQRSSALEVERGLTGRRRESKNERRGWIERTAGKRSFNKSPSPSESPAVFVGGLGRKSKAGSDGDDGIEAVRAKLMFDLQAAADKMKDAILREGLEDEPAAAAVSATAEAAEVVRPWNLRTRRAACKAPKANGMNGPIGGGGDIGGVSVNGGVAKSTKVDERKSNFSSLRIESKSPRLRHDGTASAVEAPTGGKRERPKFSVSLSRKEIEEDFRELTGHRPHRRPKKRPKIVQKELDSLFPGLWLTEVTFDAYKVLDAPDTEKR
ncbi:hypothetical protein U1Q18_002272 [Sarracenia purpurea var. burkii]